MRSHTRFLFATVASCALVAIVAGGATCFATTVIPVDLEALTRGSVAVVRGRVSAVDGRWTDDRRAIETIVTLDVDEYLKGELGPAVQFRVPGGLLGRFRSIVVGAPRFAVDDRIIVFLGAKGPTIPYVVGFSQGVYRVVRDVPRSVWRVTPPPLPASAETPVAIVRGDPARVPLTLADFEARVRALAGNAR